MTITIRAHFKDKTIVPDQPLEIPQGQELEMKMRVVETPFAKRTRLRRSPSQLTKCLYVIRDRTPSFLPPSPHRVLPYSV